jgi:D-xylulose reductase
MSSTAAQFPNAQPEPSVFKPKNNPGFILHGKLDTSFEEVGAICLRSSSY